MKRAAAFLLGLALALAAGATTHINDGGTWRQLAGVYVNDSGTWRTIKQVYVNDGGTWRTVYTSELLSTTITAAFDGSTYCGYNQGLYGSIGTATYSDAGGNSRTIRVIVWNCDTLDSVVFTLDGASVPDTDTTFSSLVISDVTFNRSARSTYNGAAGGGTLSQWVWTGVDTSAIPTSGSVSLVVQ